MGALGSPLGGRRFLLLCFALLAVPTRNGVAGESGTGDPARGSPEAEAPTRRGLTPSLIYEGTVLANLAGGRRTGSTAVGNLHLMLTAHADALGHPGTSAFVDVLSLHGGAPGNLVGDAQGVSNIAGPVGVELEEAWVQQEFPTAFVSVLAGLYDLNSEFYTLQSSGLFLNGSFGIGPEFAQSGVEGPSVFPRTSVGLRLAWKPGPDAVVRVALLDGAPVVRQDHSHAAFRRGDGVLGVVEVAAPSYIGRSEARTLDVVDRIGRFASLVPFGSKLAAGVWHYSGRYNDLSDVDAAGLSVRRRGSSGAYAVGERELWKGSGAGRHLSGFFQTGIADPRTNRFGMYLGSGIVAAGWGPMREGDQIGLAVARAVNGAHYRRAASEESVRIARAETTLEFSYLARAGKSLVVQPDLQHVVRPDTSKVWRNAWVLQCRFQLAL